jgi:hypothetical protein
MSVMGPLQGFHLVEPGGPTRISSARPISSYSPRIGIRRTVGAVDLGTVEGDESSVTARRTRLASSNRAVLVISLLFSSTDGWE